MRPTCEHQFPYIRADGVFSMGCRLTEVYEGLHLDEFDECSCENCPERSKRFPMQNDIFEIIEDTANDVPDNESLKIHKVYLKMCVSEIRRCWAEIEELRKEAE